MEKQKKFWSRYASIYTRFVTNGRGAKHAYAEMKKEIAHLLTKEMNVLELAAGPGILSREIALSCKHLTATDFSETMIKEAKKADAPSNVQFEIADATELFYADDTFDAVVIANALHIMPAPDKALKQIRRVLKRDGILIAPTFTREDVRSKALERFMEVFGFRTFSKWTPHTYQQYLESQGWEICMAEIIKGHNFPISFLAARNQKDTK